MRFVSLIDLKQIKLISVLKHLIHMFLDVNVVDSKSFDRVFEMVDQIYLSSRVFVEHVVVVQKYYHTLRYQTKYRLF